MKKRIGSKRNHLLLFLFFSVLYYGCSKTDYYGLSKQEKTAKFFSAKTTPKPIVNEVIRKLRRKNLQYDFAAKVADKAGYPVWDKAILLQSKKKATNLHSRTMEEAEEPFYIYTPLCLENTDFVNAMLITRIVDTTENYKIVYANEYDNYQFENNDPNKATADEVAKLFMSLELGVFDHKEFDIKDHRLFSEKDIASNRNKYAPTVTLQRVEAASSMIEIVVCEEVWYDPDGDADPCDCSGNEYFDHWECKSYFITGNGGGPSGGNNGNGGNSGNGNGGTDPGSGGTLGNGSNDPGYNGGTGNQTWDHVPDPDKNDNGTQGVLDHLDGWDANDDFQIDPTNKDSIIIAKLKVMSVAINDTAKSLFEKANQPAHNKEWGFIIVNKNDSIYSKNTKGGLYENYTPFDYTISAGETLLGDFHVHQSGTSDSTDRPSFSGDDVNVLRKFQTKKGFTSMIECGNARYALVIEDPIKAATFFSTHNKLQLKEAGAEAYGLSGATSNWQKATRNAIINLLNPSTTSGIGFYICPNTQNNNFTKLN